jgi:hypothetical protein
MPHTPPAPPVPARRPTGAPAAADRIPPAVFQEARYVDGLGYHETAGGEAPDDWEAAA